MGQVPAYRELTVVYPEGPGRASRVTEMYHLQTAVPCRLVYDELVSGEYASSAMPAFLSLHSHDCNCQESSFLGIICSTSCLHLIFFHLPFHLPLVQGPYLILFTCVCRWGREGASWTQEVRDGNNCCPLWPSDRNFQGCFRSRGGKVHRLLWISHGILNLCLYHKIVMTYFCIWESPNCC